MSISFGTRLECDRETMNEKAAVVGKLMQNSFDSWKDLVSCYLEGYCDWAKEEFEPDVARENIRVRKESYELVKNHVYPAYSVDWNLKL